MMCPARCRYLRSSTDPGKLSADRIGIVPPPDLPAGDQPLGAWMTVNIRVLPQAGVRTVVLAGTEHQSKPIAMPTRLSLLLAGPEAQVSR